MPVQSFTVQEIEVLKTAAQNLVNNPSFAATGQNMTKAQQKAADSATIQTMIDSISLQITNLDDKYTTLKANELTSLNASLSFYQDLQTKILNTPE